MMQGFYEGVLGFAVTDRGMLGSVEIVFLSRDAREHHQIALVSGRPAALDFNIVNQISLRAQTLSDLREVFSLLDREGVEELVGITHGIAWSIYCRDPEGNRIEIFTDTPWYVEQPHREPIDLRRPEPEILAETEARIKHHPSFRPLAEWRKDFARSLAYTKSR
jgi:catechol-2,3-dioxygenase